MGQISLTMPTWTSGNPATHRDPPKSNQGHVVKIQNGGQPAAFLCLGQGWRAAEVLPVAHNSVNGRNRLKSSSPFGQ